MNTPASIESVIQVRDALPSDMAFIYSTWLRDLRGADASPLPDDIWFPAHREYINRALSDIRVQAKVLYSPEQPRRILGYVIAEPHEVLLWIFLRPKFHGQKLTKLLLSAVKAESAPAAFTTQASRSSLHNPRRSRQLRPRFQLFQLSPVDSKLTEPLSDA